MDNIPKQKGNSSRQNGSCIPPTQRSSLQSSWLVSFGDLLTLLLCFFVAIVAYHTQGEGGKGHVSSQNNEENHSPSQLYQIREASGTPIANLKESEGRLVLRFEPVDYQGLQEQLTEKAKRWLQKAIKSDDYSLTAMRLEVCGNTAPDQEGQAWLISMRRALDIRRQLVDAGFSTEGFELELLGSDCSKLESKGGRKTVAALTLETKREIHG